MEDRITVRITMPFNKNALKNLSNCRKISFKPIINSIESVVKIPCLDAKAKYNSEIENEMTLEALDKTEGLFW